MTNWKFHAIALGCIITLIVVVFLVTAPPKEVVVEGTPTNPDRFIQVHKASYGLNCNARIRRYGNQNAEPVNPNNVLLDVSRICNGQETCTIEVKDTSFSKQFASGCSKELEVEYRCFSWDRPWKAFGAPYEQMVIDCRNH